MNRISMIFIIWLLYGCGGGGDSSDSTVNTADKPNTLQLSQNVDSLEIGELYTLTAQNDTIAEGYHEATLNDTTLELYSNGDALDFVLPYDLKTGNHTLEIRINNKDFTFDFASKSMPMVDSETLREDGTAFLIELSETLNDLTLTDAIIDSNPELAWFSEAFTEITNDPSTLTDEQLALILLLEDKYLANDVTPLTVTALTSKIDATPQAESYCRQSDRAVVAYIVTGAAAAFYVSAINPEPVTKTLAVGVTLAIFYELSNRVIGALGECLERVSQNIVSDFSTNDAIEYTVKEIIDTTGQVEFQTQVPTPFKLEIEYAYPSQWRTLFPTLRSIIKRLAYLIPRDEIILDLINKEGKRLSPANQIYIASENPQITTGIQPRDEESFFIIVSSKEAFDTNIEFSFTLEDLLSDLSSRHYGVLIPSSHCPYIREDNTAYIDLPDSCQAYSILQQDGIDIIWSIRNYKYKLIDRETHYDEYSDLNELDVAALLEFAPYTTYYIGSKTFERTYSEEIEDGIYFSYPYDELYFRDGYIESKFTYHDYELLSGFAKGVIITNPTQLIAPEYSMTYSPTGELLSFAHYYQPIAPNDFLGGDLSNLLKLKVKTNANGSIQQLNTYNIPAIQYRGEETYGKTTFKLTFTPDNQSCTVNETTLLSEEPDSIISSCTGHKIKYTTPLSNRDGTITSVPEEISSTGTIVISSDIWAPYKHPASGEWTSFGVYNETIDTSTGTTTVSEGLEPEIGPDGYWGTALAKQTIRTDSQTSITESFGDLLWHKPNNINLERNEPTSVLVKVVEANADTETTYTYSDPMLNGNNQYQSVLTMEEIHVNGILNRTRTYEVYEDSGDYTYFTSRTTRIDFIDIGCYQTYDTEGNTTIDTCHSEN